MFSLEFIFFDNVFIVILLSAQRQCDQIDTGELKCLQSTQFKIKEKIPMNLKPKQYSFRFQENFLCLRYVNTQISLTLS